MTEKTRILVVDDELSMREFLDILLVRAGYQVETCSSAEEAMRALERESFELVLTDLNLPGMSGIELMRASRESLGLSGVPFILVTAFGTTSTAVEAMKEGAFDYILKPFSNDELLIIIQKALGHLALQRENLELRRAAHQTTWFGSLIGNSPRIRQVYELVERIKDIPISCLLCGESGTGKEMFARAIHEAGSLREGPFVAVNCGAIPENLMESELFGHVKGAFTGADRNKQGYFQAAHRGTLFLDEIGEMPLQAQVKLLRALAERRIRPVGGQSELPVQVRILAATNRDLELEVQEGRFREDLFYRLNGLKLDLPPLRERGEDVLLLADSFLLRFAEQMKKRVISLRSDTRELLMSYPWPGNIRELKNAIESAVALEEQAQLTPSSFQEKIRGHRFPSDHGETLSRAPTPTLSAPESLIPEEGVNLDEILGSLERHYIQEALAQSKGQKTKAAKLLGLSFRSFRYRLAKLDLDVEL